FDRFTPRFVKQYRQIGKEIVDAFMEFKADIKSGSFPSDEHAFAGFSREEADAILTEIKS
ncbi:MAG TPA: 3-methyl-2-oxobutanoate hydroxymethyltransferase, partial [Synergistaceae bacterium]|nr:3-methyl-2-oxobutanoate hydroxymethyltransferase [Synergistaceae bacterium]